MQQGQGQGRRPSKHGDEHPLSAAHSEHRRKKEEEGQGRKFARTCSIDLLIFLQVQATVLYKYRDRVKMC